MTVSVIASQDIRCRRIINRDGLSEEEALHRIGAQHSDNFYMERSWAVLQNNGDVSELKLQADSLLDRLAVLMEQQDEEKGQEETL